jgi:segregation and condensation protein A
MTDLPMQDDYKVELDVYSGPLELLLYLIRRDEVDIKDIPIARITEQYLRHVEVISRIDINLAGEFLVMAATLMEIKSRMLIPRIAQGGEAGEGESAPASVEELTDPRYELVKQLLAYKAFKDAAMGLKRRAETEAARYPRAVPKPQGRAPLAIEDLDLFRLIDAFNAIMASVGHSAYGHEVVYDDTPISLHQADILDRLVRDGGGLGGEGLTLQELFAGRQKKSEMIGLFLATLELIRQKKIAVEQTETLGLIRIRLREEGDQTLFAESTGAPIEGGGSGGDEDKHAEGVSEGGDGDAAEAEAAGGELAGAGGGAGGEEEKGEQEEEVRGAEAGGEEEGGEGGEGVGEGAGEHPGGLEGGGGGAAGEGQPVVEHGRKGTVDAPRHDEGPPVRAGDA